MEIGISLSITGTIFLNQAPPAAPGGGGETLGPEMWPQPEFDSGAGITFLRATVGGGQLTLSPYYDAEEEFTFGATAEAPAVGISEIAAGSYKVSFDIVSTAGASVSVGIGKGSEVLGHGNGGLGSPVTAVGHHDQTVVVPTTTGSLLLLGAATVGGDVIIDNLSIKQIL
jgi:hypothetical protein